MSDLPEWFLDLDTHPAALAGPHAWRMHGMSSIEPPADHIPLLVPHRRADEVDRVLNDIRAQLACSWHIPGLDSRRTELGVEVTLPNQRTVVTVETISRSIEPAQATLTILHDGRQLPIIDRRVALVQRLSAVSPRATLPDVVDISRWVGCDQPGVSPLRRSVTTAEVLVAIREPEARCGLRAVVDHVQRNRHRPEIANHLAGIGWLDAATHQLASRSPSSR